MCAQAHKHFVYMHVCMADKRPLAKLKLSHINYQPTHFQCCFSYFNIKFSVYSLYAHICICICRYEYIMYNFMLQHVLLWFFTTIDNIRSVFRNQCKY